MKLSQDLILGLFFAAVGAISASIAVTYSFGTSSRMGPGYFPLIISSLLTVTGLAVLVRSRLRSSEDLGAIRWKPLLMVSGSIALFGLLVSAIGLPLAVLLLTVLSAATSIKFRIDWKAFAGAIVFAALCSLLFVELLGLPIPLKGSLLEALGF